MAQGDLRGTLTGSVSSVTNPTVASGSVAVSVGDLVFGTMAQQTNLTAAGTVTDNLGNTYAYVNAGTDAGTVTIRSFYARVTNAGTLTTVNVPATASANDASVVAAVIAGPFLASPLDANPANATDGTTPFTCPATGTLAQASEVVMAAIALADNETVAATSPSVIAGTVARASASVGQSRRVVAATTSVVPEFTSVTATAAQVTASFKLETTQALSPSLYSDSDTFNSATVTPGAVNLAPSLFSDGDTFFSPTVTAISPLTVSLFTDDDTFHSATVTPGAVNLAASLFSDGDSFPSAAVTPGAVDLTPSLFSDGDTFFSATVGSSYGLTASLFTDGDTFHSATVSPGAVDLAPSLVADGDTFFAATVSASNTLLPGLFTDADTFSSPTVSADGGGQTLTAERYDNSASFYSPLVEGGEDEPAPIFTVVTSGSPIDRKKLRERKPKTQLSAPVFINWNFFPSASVSESFDPAILDSDVMFAAELGAFE